MECLKILLYALITIMIICLVSSVFFISTLLNIFKNLLDIILGFLL
jgi:hypothetical protein